MESYPIPARALVAQMRDDAAIDPSRAIAFQGAPGCNGHSAALEVFPDGAPLPCFSFEDALESVVRGEAAAAVIPIENSLNGRVADIHFLLPESGLSIAGEYFHPVVHALLAKDDGSTLSEVLSHVQALGQCRRTLREKGLQPVAFIDTAAAAAEVAQRGDRSIAALAPPLAASLYDLNIVAPQLSDAEDNTIRFVTLVRDPRPVDDSGAWMTTLIFAVRSVPAALFKALSGFATNGVNRTKLESYQHYRHVHGDRILLRYRRQGRGSQRGAVLEGPSVPHSLDTHIGKLSQRPAALGTFGDGLRSGCLGVRHMIRAWQHTMPGESTARLALSLPSGCRVLAADRSRR